MQPITTAQDIYLRLIAASGQWNSFDGPAIEAALRSNAHHWRSVVFATEVSAIGRGKPTRLRDSVNLVVLRDLPKDFVALSTLFLLAEPGHQDQLEVLVRQWEADEVHWINQEEAFEAMGEGPLQNKDFQADIGRVVLRAWWD